MSLFKRKPRGDCSLDTVLLRWSKRDKLTLRDAHAGIFCTGASGSGKTSAIARAVSGAMLRVGCGGIFHATKPEDPGIALQWCRDAGRLDDVVFFGAGHPARINPLDYELNRSGSGGGLTVNIVDLLLNVSEIRDRKQGQGGGGENAEFFNNAKKQILNVTVDVLARAKGRVTVPDIHRMITSAPTSRDEFNDPRWRERSFCWECMVEAVAKTSPMDRFKSDLEIAGAYWCDEFPMMSDRTRTSIVSSITGLIDTLNRGHIRELLCGETNFTPEDLFNGKILIHTMPVAEFGEVGAMTQVMVKYALQKAVARRDVRKYPRTVFFHLDEFQSLITSYDSVFATICRSARASMVLLTQNLPTVYAALGGGDKAKQEVDSLIGNCSLKIMCANSDATTTRWAAEMIGRTRQLVMNSSSQRAMPDYSFNSMFGCDARPHASAGVSEIFEYALQPAYFSTLRTGSKANNYEVDAIIHRTGGVFHCTGTNWMKATFKQR